MQGSDRGGRYPVCATCGSRTTCRERCEVWPRANEVRAASAPEREDAQRIEMVSANEQLSGGYDHSF